MKPLMSSSRQLDMLHSVSFSSCSFELSILLAFGLNLLVRCTLRTTVYSHTHTHTSRTFKLLYKGDTLTLVYSGYSSCNMGSYDHCGAVGCCQLMFATIPVPPTVKATRLDIVLPPPGQGFYNVTTDAYMLWAPEAPDAPSTASPRGKWHMWVTEMPEGVVPPNQRGGLRNIGHLVADGTPATLPTTGWTYASTAVFPSRNLTRWSRFAVDEPRVYPLEGGGWIMCVNVSRASVL